MLIPLFLRIFLLKLSGSINAAKEEKLQIRICVNFNAKSWCGEACAQEIIEKFRAWIRPALKPIRRRDKPSRSKCPSLLSKWLCAFNTA